MTISGRNKRVIIILMEGFWFRLITCFQGCLAFLETGSSEIKSRHPFDYKNNKCVNGFLNHVVFLTFIRLDNYSNFPHHA